jgi:hypothetical protein
MLGVCLSLVYLTESIISIHLIGSLNIGRCVVHSTRHERGTIFTCDIETTIQIRHWFDLIVSNLFELDSHVLALGVEGIPLRCGVRTTTEGHLNSGWEILVPY